MKIIWLILLIAIILSTNLFAQKEGDKWVIGYYSNGDTNYSIMHLDFSHSVMQVEWHYQEDLVMRETCANICDADGNAILWTNGMEIFGRGGIRIIDTIAYEYGPVYWNLNYLDGYGPLGFIEHCGALILPIPMSENEYIVIYHSEEILPNNVQGIGTTRYLTSRINVNSNYDYTVSYKDSLLGPRLESYTSTISAVRHANGRDWWVVVFESDSPNYFSYLLDPTGIHLNHQGAIDIPVYEGYGNATFSKYGNYFARMDQLPDSDDGQVITLYSFDRCSGDLNRLETINMEWSFLGGVAFSPSERYLYADDNNRLWQWDLWSSNILASQSLVDTFDGFVQPGWFEMYFGPMVQGPDDRIYVIPPEGSSEFIHVIDRPDLPADQCYFRQHYFNLTKPNGRSAPNIPNYRLGPLDGSSCDTLGLNNHPVSRWRYEEEYPNNLNLIRFTDLSFFDPQIWHWDFDDGSIDDIPSPVHNFTPGLYHVCLTVSNQYDTDSSCQWVEILTTSVKDDRTKISPEITISPNPYIDNIFLQTQSGLYQNVNIKIWDVNGKTLFNQKSVLIPSKIFLPNFPSGVYFCNIVKMNGIIESFKLIKL